MSWNDQDAVELRTFMGKNPKFLEELRNRRPETTGTSVEERALTGSDVKGYDDCLKEIESLRTHVDKFPGNSPYIA